MVATIIARNAGTVNRLEFLDLFRGFIMIIMAWDHIGHQFTSERDLPRVPGREAWEGPFQQFDNDPKKFLARSVSHICAPGFFFTMGISMTLFTLNRKEKLGWTWLQVFKHYWIRAFVLLAMEYMIDLPHGLPKLVDLLRGRDVVDSVSGAAIHPGEEHTVLLHALCGVYEVMTSLGLNMIVAPLVLPVIMDNQYELTSGWLLFLTCFVVSTLFIVSNQDLFGNTAPQGFPHWESTSNGVFQLAARFILFPGRLWNDWQMAIYPLFPWLGITLLGQGFGFEVKKHGMIRHLKLYSCVMFIVFCMIRAFGSSVNFRGTARGEEIHDSAIMTFFLQSKYPPDLAYATVTMSAVFLLLDMFTKPMFAFRFLLVFGRTPLFFYLVHFWFIMVLEALLRIPYNPWGKYDLQYLPIVWLFVITVMYFACNRFLQFKNTTPASSLWRML